MCLLCIAVAGVVSIYSVWDMLRYNRARRAEWLEAQKKLEADELATARLAYLKGEATEDQIILVEEANRRAEEAGVKLPPLLGAPEHRTHFEETIKPAFSGSEQSEAQGKGVLGFFSGLTGGNSGSGKEEAGAALQANEATSEKTAGVVHAIEGKAKEAWAREKENQQAGGSLDQLGLETGTQNQTPAKKGWWPW